MVLIKISYDGTYHRQRTNATVADVETYLRQVIQDQTIALFRSQGKVLIIPYERLKLSAIEIINEEVAINEAKKPQGTPMTKTIDMDTFVETRGQ